MKTKYAAGLLSAIALGTGSASLQERWNRSVKEECLSKIIILGEASLRHVLSNYVEHFHSERNHQGKGNVILFPATADRIGEGSGEIRSRERLGGLLRFYHREAA